MPCRPPPPPPPPPPQSLRDPVNARLATLYPG
jgi:hypothetical protein